MAFTLFEQLHLNHVASVPTAPAKTEFNKTLENNRSKMEAGSNDHPK